jgi:hypothetical protein
MLSVIVIPSSKFADHTLKTMQWCTAMAVLYIGLIFILPASQAAMQHYHLSALEYRVATASLALPTIVVWFAAFWGYAKLREYSQAIAKSKEGSHFAQLGNGCAWLAWSLPLTTISAFVLNGISNWQPTFHPTAIILANYIALIVPLIAFVVIGLAARNMVGKLHLNLDLTSARLTMLLFLAGGIAYCFLIFHRLDPMSLTSTHNSYFLPIWLLIVSVIIPYLYAWFIGLLAAYEITLFGVNMHGLLYRRALLYMVSGFVAVILSSIALQYLDSVVPRTGALLFNYKLLLTLVIRVVSGIGFFTLAIGASKLKKIEEV